MDQKKTERDVKISPKRRAEIMSALRRGTVPACGLALLAMGLERFHESVDDELDTVADGRGIFKAVRGEYGCGKTFFARWLQARDIEVFESDEREPTTYSTKDLTVTTKEQVARLPHERTLLELYEETAASHEESRSSVATATVRRVAGVRSVAELDITVRTVANATQSAPHKLVFEPEDGISLPAIYPTTTFPIKS